LNKNQTYRLLAAYLLTALIAQVFILQGIHHILGHHDHDKPCETSIVHFHSSEHGHFSCDICLFQFAPTEVIDSDLVLDQKSILLNDNLSFYQKQYLTQRFFQNYLRGPPVCSA